MKKWITSILTVALSFFAFGTGQAFAEQPATLTPEMINGESAVLMDGTTGTILFEKNPHKPLYPASITKIATAIYTIERGAINDTAIVSKKARHAEGTRVYLEEGESVSMKNLLYGLIMHSGNDAAIVIAEHLDGSTEVFSEKVTNYLKEKVNVQNTNFTNPHGLHDDNHYTTAYDMAKISRYAMADPLLREIAGTKTYEWHQQEWDTVLVNHNKMLRNYEGTTGLKNGFTDQAGNTLVVTAKRGDTELIAVTMKAPSSAFSYKDVTALLDYGFANYETQQIATGGQSFVYTGENEKEEPMKFFAESNLYATVPKDQTYATEIQNTGDLVVQFENGDKTILHLKAEKKEEKAEVLAASLPEEKNKIALYGITVGWSFLNLFMLLYLFKMIKIKRRNVVYRKRNY
ncbi:D-alanyl-D-alanine carboxypeptidase family protein [Brevibacillus daliensis]|uniref:D-alanyl-D-alanine carboxypeptidase family protein n=1 Tax=Brevibacillus daliensis TaxID=2892995 RepID=UPI001E487DA6|nr:D-alanyl-D-alanine carboxypeptidase family protein [Brevibacillus daliensis]